MQTLSIDESAPASTTRVDHLYLSFAGGKPGIGARWALDGIDAIEIGRGAIGKTTRDGSTLRIECVDPWMSTNHLRFVREAAIWSVVDAGSRNGFLVSGVKQQRAVVEPTDVIEAGRSFFLLRAGETATGPDLEITSGRPLATLDPHLAQMVANLRHIATTAIPVLIVGPSGTGKERFAHAVHTQSRRRGAFVPVNCGALPAGLVESELFGHKKGAFSGAIGDSEGLVVASSGGTLFLDEVADLPPPSQAALLRVLEEHEVRAVGSSSTTSVDLRIVAATNRDLAMMIDDGEFREDLFSRLAGIVYELPALVERRVDLGIMIGELAPDSTWSAAAIRALYAYAWPRNMRELVRTVERAVALTTGDIERDHLPPETANAVFAPAATVDARRDELVALLKTHRGNVSRIAGELGRTRQYVQRQLKRHELDAERYRS